MHVKHLPLLIVLFCLVTIHSGCDNKSNAQSSQIDFTESYSGSFISGSVNTDSNGDGINALVSTLKGTSSLGNFTMEMIAEIIPIEGNTLCIQADQEWELVPGFFVKRFENGDLLYGEWTSGFNCSNAPTATAVLTMTGTIVGGTGEFEGATGVVQTIIDRNFLTKTGENGYAFGSSVGSGSGTVVTP